MTEREIERKEKKMKNKTGFEQEIRSRTRQLAQKIRVTVRIYVKWRLKFDDLNRRYKARGGRYELLRNRITPPLMRVEGRIRELRTAVMALQLDVLESDEDLPTSVMDRVRNLSQLDMHVEDRLRHAEMELQLYEWREIWEARK